jgi:3-hydroxyacyl-CoA dehydrogenase/enoyl-CoA hydratase/3-hydroxybutyryl-CoA epimerase
MGASIAHISAAAGISVVLLDCRLELAQHGKAHSATLLHQDIVRGALTREQADTVLARITPSVHYADLAGCDLVIEARLESRDVKAATMIGNAEAVTGLDTIVASTTSTLRISALAEASKRPRQFIGIHFFSPVEKTSLVEIIVGKQTSSETIARVMDYAAQLKATPIVVNDSPGFYANRIFIGFIDEGMCMLQEGVEPALIENAARLAGMPLGPLAATDEASIDLQWQILTQAQAAGLEEKFRRLPAYNVIRRMTLELKRLGRRFGAGFYDYPRDAKAYLWPGLKERFPPRREQPDVEEVKQRLLYIQALEGARCFEEAVVSHPADADLGAVLGVGFPSWTGGPLSLIETVGLDRFVAECKRMAERYGPRFQPPPGLVARARRGEKFYPAI